MKIRSLTLKAIRTIIYSNIVIATAVSAQEIVGDNTLPNNSTVTVNGMVQRIDGGTEAGNNLLHSFAKFNVSTGYSAYFNNSSTIENIFTRVTGADISNIDGLIKANGEANLFLLNPNGIVFGANAQLELGGSFFATTAERIIFDDGNFFSVEEPNQIPPLLTINVPLGLQFNQSPGNIQVQESNLRVTSQQNLTLVGGNITIDGGKLLAEDGKVGLTGLAEAGLINLQDNSLRLPQEVERGNLTLDNGAVVEVRGENGGGINIQVNNLDIANGAKLQGRIISGSTENNRLDVMAGDITVDALGEINLTSGGRIISVTGGRGKGGNIVLEAGEINISGFTEDGLFSGILSHSETDNSGEGGRITINSPEGTVELGDRGFIAAVTDSSNSSGSIEVNSNNLVIESGGQIITATSNSGNAGDITINAETITMGGSSEDFLVSPFTDVEVFNLDELAFYTDFNSEIEDYGTGGIPYVSIQRNPTEIVSGNTILGTATEQYDYYSFTVTKANSRGIFDIDGGDGYEDIPGSLDTEIAIFNLATGEIIGINDDSNIENGGEGSIVRQDSYIDTTFAEPGTYVLGVGEFDTVPSSLNLLSGDRVDPGDTYRLQISLQNQGVEISIPTNTINPDNFNPNYGASSGLVSLTEGEGNTGKLTLNTDNLLLEPGGSITATTSGMGSGRDITLNVTDTVAMNNATVANITRGTGNAGSIIINSSEVNLQNRTFLDTSNFGQGNAGDITINADNVNLLTATILNSSTYVVGDAGIISINATDTITLDGELDGDVTVIASLVAGPSAVGNSGGIEINTGSLLLSNGAFLDTTTYGTGNAGIIDIRASDRVIIDGASSNGRGSNLISRVRVTGRGNGGDINIATDVLAVTNGGILTTQTEGVGDAGNIQIEAREIYLSDGTIASTVEAAAVGDGGQISLNSNSLVLENGARVTASTAGEGNGGEIIIASDNVIEVDNSTIAVSSEGEGIGGRIQLRGNLLSLDNQALITAETEARNGGDITIWLQDLLLMRRESNISATAGSAGAGGDGGNIRIQVPLILTIPQENSDITANAFEGAGGTIEIDSQGIFGTQFREQLTPESDITANSQFGISGSVIINNPEVEPSSGLVKLSGQVIQAGNEVIVGCRATVGNSFTITGRGGLPEDPTSALRGTMAWSDLEDYTAVGVGENLPREEKRYSSGGFATLVQATGWLINDDGEVELITGDSSRSNYEQDYPSCQNLQKDIAVDS